MSSLDEQGSGRGLPRQVFSLETLKANIGAQVGTVRATTWPWRIESGCLRAKTGGVPKNGFSTSSGLWRTSVYCGGLVPSTGLRIPIRASDGSPRNSLKKETSSVVDSVTAFDGLASVIDQATI